MLSPPTSIVAEREGFNSLADVGALGLPFLHNGIALSRRFIRDNPDTVKRYVKSQIEAVHLMKTDRKTSVAVLAKYMRQTANQGFLKEVTISLPPIRSIRANNIRALAGIQTVLNAIADDNPKAKAARPEQFVDARFIRELDDSGYIDALYKKSSR